MRENRFILSEAPDALDGALEWLDAEIEQEEENNRLSKEIEEHIRPLVMKIAEEQGLLSPCQQKA